MNDPAGRRSRVGVLPVVLVCALGATIARTLRWPNDWAEGHWLISYEFGFLKRSLAGTLLKPVLGFDGVDPELVIRIVSTVLSVAFHAGLLVLAYRLVRAAPRNAFSRLAVLVFVTSPYVVMSAHLNGYFDLVTTMLAVAACRLVLSGRTTLAAALVAAGLLIHETIFLVGFPSVLFAGLLVQIRQEEGPPTGLASRFARRHALLLALPVAVFLSVFLFQNLLPEPVELRTRIAEFLARFELIERQRHIVVARAYSMPFADYWATQSPRFAERLLSPDYLRQVLPPVALLLALMARVLRGRAHAGWLLAVASGVTLLPLSLHAIAWDTGRIWMYPILVAALSAWTAGEVFPAAASSAPARPGLAMAAAVWIAVQAFTSTALLDKQVERFSSAERTLLYAPTFLFAGWLLLCRRGPTTARTSSARYPAP